MTSLTLAMVLKNAAADLRASVESVRFDQFVAVVDADCTDGTDDLARELGATTKIAPFPDSFSVLRNLALDMATSDWVLSLDADEKLAGKLPELVGDVAYCPTYTAPSIVCGPRLFRREGARWMYRAHEQVRYGREPPKMEAPVDFMLEHNRHPYSPAYHERCVRLLKMDAAENPGDFYVQARLGTAMLHAGDIAGWPILEDAVRKFPRGICAGRGAYELLLSKVGGRTALGLAKRARADGFDGMWLRAIEARAWLGLNRHQEAVAALTNAHKLPWDRHGDFRVIEAECIRLWRAAGQK